MSYQMYRGDPPQLFTSTQVKITGKMRSSSFIGSLWRLWVAGGGDESEVARARWSLHQCVRHGMEEGP